MVKPEEVARYECWCCFPQTEPEEVVRYSDYAAVVERLREIMQQAKGQLEGRVGETTDTMRCDNAYITLSEALKETE
jgi:hypothetical protein